MIEASSRRAFKLLCGFSRIGVVIDGEIECPFIAPWVNGMLIQTS